MKTRATLAAWAISLVVVPPAVLVSAAEPVKTPVVIDTDLGSDIDDAFALGLALASPELDVRAVTTVTEGAEVRAWMVCRLLTAVERRNIPVAWGRDPQVKQPITGQFQYRYHPAVIYNRTVKPTKEDAVETLYAAFKADPGKITLLALGPLTNVAQLLEQHPDCKPWIRQIVCTEAGLAIGDPEAARNVLKSGVPLVIVPARLTKDLELADPQPLFQHVTQITLQLKTLTQLWNGDRPPLASAAAVALMVDPRLGKLGKERAEFDDRGGIRVVPGEANSQVAADLDREALLGQLVRRIQAFGPTALPKPPGNRTTTIAQRGLPTRVHAYEDYDTDIERRWWLCGKEETKLALPGHGRACRGVLTLDFDDLMGNLATNYTAVVFNPVPGPPMGPRTRLSFRYRLSGTDTLRVQLYSLSNGYHRYLSLDKLPKDAWTAATVDMTAMRRPDGSGGPLAADERIDDIQFYVDPRAEILVDDVVLYDEAPEGEQRPFPKRFMYTGWFDTGKQGAEWPGDFEIVPHEPPRKWKAAHAVPRKDPVTSKDSDQRWIRLSLRGERFLGATNELRFRYKFVGDGPVRVVLRNPRTKLELAQEFKEPTKDEWSEASLSFKLPDGQLPDEGRKVSEIEFALPAGADLWVDDVLLFEPGEIASP